VEDFFFISDENPRSQSIMTLCWGALVRLFSGHHPTFLSYQNSLPRMPVPSLSDTCRKFMLSMKPLLDDDEYKEMEALAKVRWPPMYNYFNKGHIFIAQFN